MPLISKLILLAVFTFAYGNSHGQKSPAVPKGDTILTKEFIGRANKALAVPRVSDSLATIIYNHAHNLKNEEYMGKGAVMKFTALLLMNGPEKAMPWYNIAQPHLIKSNNYLWKGYANMNIGGVYKTKYNFDKAIRYLLIANKDFEQAEDTNMVVMDLISMSGAFHDFGNYQNGKKYANEALAIIKTMPNPSAALKWRALSTLEINYDDNKEYAKALATSFEAIKYAEDNDGFQASTYNNIGNTYQKKGELTQARRYFMIALAKAKKGGGDYDFATIYNNLSNINLTTGKLKDANFYIDSAIIYSEKSESPEKLIDTYETAYKLFSKTANYKKATQYLKLYGHLKDSLLSAEKARIVYDLQIKYDTEKKDLQNQRLSYANKLEVAERRKAEADKKLIAVIAITTLLIALLVFWFIYRSRLMRNKHEEEQKLNKAIFEGEQNERIRIARDLHDSIGQMLSVVKMNVSVLQDKEPDDPTVKNASNLVDKTIAEVRHISHNLLPEGLNLGLFAALQDLCDKVNAAGTTEVMMNVPEEIRSYQFAKPNELSIYRIVQEVLNNMIKHAQATHIDIDIIQQEKNLSLSIRDNGKGFDTGEIASSKGIGWKNIAARVNLLDGQMQVQSEQLKGTRIDIVIPQ